MNRIVRGLTVVVVVTLSGIWQEGAARAKCVVRVPFTIDPAVKGVDYTVSNILAEAFPSEVHDLYKKYSESYASGQNIVNLNVVTNLADSASAVQ